MLCSRVNTRQREGHNLLVPWLGLKSCGPVAQWITRLPTEQKIVGSSPAWIEKSFCPIIFSGTVCPSQLQPGTCSTENAVECHSMLPVTCYGEKKKPPPGGLEPPTFRLTAERASQLRHGGMLCYAQFTLRSKAGTFTLPPGWVLIILCISLFSCPSGMV